MTKEQCDKITQFINDLIEFKLDKMKLDHFISKKKEYYSIEIDSGVPLIITGLSSFNLSFSNQMIYFSVCEDGGIVLSREEMYSDNDEVFAKKYFNILRDLYIKRQSEIIDNIVDKSYSDLKLRRESNIGKLI
jgi:hypothetical protein